jgi:hypothetical protein
MNTIVRLTKFHELNVSRSEFVAFEPHSYDSLDYSRFLPLSFCLTSPGPWH